MSLKDLTKGKVEKFLNDCIKREVDIPKNRKAKKYHLLYKDHRFPPKWVCTEILNILPRETESPHCVRKLKRLGFNIVTI